jgi:uncharacterized membrane protein
MFGRTWLNSSIGRNRPEKAARSRRRHRLNKGIVVFAAAVLLLGAMGAQEWAAAKDVAPVSGAKEVAYPANMFDNGKAQHFEHKTTDGVTIRYFVMKSSDGVIRAAFDACNVCWREGKGYVQQDNFMVCRNCGRRFLSTKINEVSGGCNPAPLTRKIEGDKVLIGVEHILAGKRYFALGGGRS